MFEQQLRALRAQIDAGQFDAAEAAIKALHVSYHRCWREHLRLHLCWLQLEWRRGRPLASAWQLLPVLFAVPVSLAHRYLGWAVVAHRKDSEKRQ